MPWHFFQAYRLALIVTVYGLFVYLFFLFLLSWIYYWHNDPYSTHNLHCCMVFTLRLWWKCAVYTHDEYLDIIRNQGKRPCLTWWLQPLHILTPVVIPGMQWRKSSALPAKLTRQRFHLVFIMACTSCFSWILTQCLFQFPLWSTCLSVSIVLREHKSVSFSRQDKIPCTWHSCFTFLCFRLFSKIMPGQGSNASHHG